MEKPPKFKKFLFDQVQINIIEQALEFASINGLSPDERTAAKQTKIVLHKQAIAHDVEEDSDGNVYAYFKSIV